VATTLPRGETSTAGFGSYHAANYDELIDHPVEMSDFALASFEAGGATHDVAIGGRQRADLARLTRDLVESGCGAVAVALACLLPSLSSDGAQVAVP